MKFIGTLLFSLLISICVAQKDSVKCPPEGKGASDLAKRMNVLKNRDVVNGTINPAITPATILAGGPEDTAAFKTTDYATVTGYVLEAEDAGPESCNCFSNDTAKQNIHIYLGQSVDSWKDSIFVIQITPKFKKQHPEINADGLIGQRIAVTGMMMYNFESKKFALKACKTCRTTDRKTAWEICPVTDLKVFPKPVKK